MPNEDRPRMDDFVSKLVTHPSDPPDAILLRGFLGESSEEGCIRLYFEPELRNYVEIDAGDILHTQPLTPEQSPLGGSFVWIKRETEVVYGQAAQRRPKARADFFRGAVMQQYAAAAREARAPEGVGRRIRVKSRLVICQSQLDDCPTQRTDPDCWDPIILRTKVPILCETQNPMDWRCWNIESLWSDPDCPIVSRDWRLECLPP